MCLNGNEWNNKVCFDRKITHSKMTVMHFKICLDLRLLVVLCFHWCFWLNFGSWFISFCTYQLTRHIIYRTFGPCTLSTNNSNAVSDGCFGFCIRVWNVLEILLHQASSKQLVAQWSKAYLSWQGNGSKQKKNRTTSRFYWITSSSLLLGIEILSVSGSFLQSWSLFKCVFCSTSKSIQVNLFTPSPFFLPLSFFLNHFLINLSFLSVSSFHFISHSASFLSLILYTLERAFQQG